MKGIPDQMRVYIDTEFMESPGTIELLSLGLVREDGKELYAVNGDANHKLANPWVQENVLPHLGGPLFCHHEIKQMVLEFTRDISPEFWGYYCDYDWVVFCWLFGAMLDLPKGYPMYCRDIKQWCSDLGDPKLPEQEGIQHNALEDARWNQQAWHFLDNYSRNGLVAP